MLPPQERNCNNTYDWASGLHTCNEIVCIFHRFTREKILFYFKNVQSIWVLVNLGLTFKFVAKVNVCFVGRRVNNHSGRLPNVHSLTGKHKFIIIWLREITELSQKCCLMKWWVKRWVIWSKILSRLLTVRWPLLIF